MCLLPSTGHRRGPLGKKRRRRDRSNWPRYPCKVCVGVSMGRREVSGVGGVSWISIGVQMAGTSPNALAPLFDFNVRAGHVRRCRCLSRRAPKFSTRTFQSRMGQPPFEWHGPCADRLGRWERNWLGRCREPKRAGEGGGGDVHICASPFQREEKGQFEPAPGVQVSSQPNGWGEETLLRREATRRHTGRPLAWLLGFAPNSSKRAGHVYARFP